MNDSDRPLEYRDYEAVRIPAAYDIQRRPTQLRIRITCPFCESDVVAYVWSLAGCGKKCGCGAVFTSFGRAYKKKAEVDAR